ncbi:uncharacterized protein L969DRAFT_94305 [Mixia osmundae IAM 14324]|uniref:Purine permease n=1 Tax=Mixia osmundae (strain CBS 9802 / IAM 14324 / JCM 22182 / KY 12970) TaxID=764103 RepID=G7E8G7_MIXOS|nr:uncharacterized protein L969DRAFT_94305 [Mixia osmundae IAM 14324]KEI39229.1 hypothetical protein L969DRAFT_94305 [Mixia osmundae IAM 14324]GAA99127.1 hypothetical protein E5Q_05817 [Mixia osmundae IAM 14324]
MLRCTCGVLRLRTQSFRQHGTRAASQNRGSEPDATAFNLTPYIWPTVLLIAITSLAVNNKRVRTEADVATSRYLAQISVLERLVAQARRGQYISDQDLLRELRAVKLRARDPTAAPDDLSDRIGWLEAFLGAKKYSKRAKQSAEQDLQQIIEVQQAADEAAKAVIKPHSIQGSLSLPQEKTPQDRDSDDISRMITEEPTAYAAPYVAEMSAEDLTSLIDSTTTKLPTLDQVKHKLTTRDGWLGDFDYAWLCLPTLPCLHTGRFRTKSTPFYGLTDTLPIVLAVVAGFQHFLAMLAGVITPPIILASELGFGPSLQNYLVSSAFIASGILSAAQMTRFRFPFTTYTYGTGLITVVGISFATLSTASAIFTVLYANGTCPSTTAADGTVTRGECREAYGYLLGTSAVCSLFEMLLSFVNPKTLRKIFPPVVSGIVVILIGASLVGDSGILNWMGGAGPCSSLPVEAGSIFAKCPTIFAKHALPWGSAQYLGLGFVTFLTIVLCEVFGSPFMKNAGIVIGLGVGCLVAGPAGYIDGSTVRSAPVITFTWVETFPLKVYGPAVLPLLAVYLALSLEATGDITASSEASRQPTSGELYSSRVQGGILADGFNSMISALMTQPPLSIFAQNCGIIAATGNANRFSGYICAVFLILAGVLSKISGVFLAIPNSVLGGATSYLFATVVTSGIRVVAMMPFTRRNRFVLTSGLVFGLGALLRPNWASFIFTSPEVGGNRALRGFEDSIVIVLETPFLIGAIVATIVNAILPGEVQPTTTIITQSEPANQGPVDPAQLESQSGSDRASEDHKEKPHLTS